LGKIAGYLSVGMLSKIKINVDCIDCSFGKGKNYV